MLFALEQTTRGGERGPHMLFPILLLLLLGWIVLRVIRRRRGGNHWHTHGSPMQTLQDRFARGVIDREEFEHRKAVLNGSDDVPPAPARATPSPPVAPNPEATSEVGPDVGSDDAEG